MKKSEILFTGKKVSTLFAISTLLGTALFANDNLVLDYEKKRVSQNPNVKVKDIKINTKKELALAGWTGYILDIDAVVQGKEIKAKDFLFTNGTHIAPELIDMKTMQSLKDSLFPNLTEKYYNKSNFIAGNEKAKNKIVLFSDPLCPFCMDYIPTVIAEVNKNKENIALYYYAFPLTQIHPASLPLSKIIEVAHNKGVADIITKAYTADWSKYFDEKDTDEAKILEAFNKEFGTDIKIEELNKKELNDKIAKDISMGDDVMVSGTPTIYVNGVKESPKFNFDTLGK
ncbi:DsbA family protein [Aliarcobacter cibarius]|jgi:thiol:disulfide interchange protein DsbC|uniref:Disulfide bond formation protein DsbA n=1 Tax=Aliarcobacter cibarius TaxID=255507 RepID=A0ABY2V807_9BACT|nr:thioredoxin domain-containing protein [Aliarcobacter cibarius]QEZ89809.1 protein disulfide isomerase [Aliarcobacter cibarius]TLT01033.1 disulfide bond formation protein DsbA [Aliarcobacter cibarius]TLT01130.1 disulfide bond formation protein DsbA [Aliarcobacter cibarius]